MSALLNRQLPPLGRQNVGGGVYTVTGGTSMIFASSGASVARVQWDETSRDAIRSGLQFRGPAFGLFDRFRLEIEVLPLFTTAFPVASFNEMAVNVGFVGVGTDDVWGRAVNTARYIISDSEVANPWRSRRAAAAPGAQAGAAFAAALAEIRASLEPLSLEEIASLVGVTRQTWHAWSTGAAVPRSRRRGRVYQLLATLRARQSHAASPVSEWFVSPLPGSRYSPRDLLIRGDAELVSILANDATTPDSETDLEAWLSGRANLPAST